MNVVADTWELFTTAETWTGPRGILSRGWAHIWVSVVAIAISSVIAIPTAVWLAHRRIAPILSVATVNLARAIPSFAIIALVLPFSIQFGFGLGFWPTCIALVALGIPPIFTNTYAGVAGVTPEQVEAARGIGMTDGEILRKVELPSSVPLVVAGLRISTVQIVATATLGALVGYECLGSFIVSGLARGDAGQPDVLLGAVCVTVLALGIDAVMGWSEPRLAPWRRATR